MDGLDGLAPPSGPQFISPSNPPNPTPPFTLVRGASLFPAPRPPPPPPPAIRGNCQTLLPRITPSPPLAPCGCLPFPSVERGSQGVAGATLEGTDKGPALPPHPGATAVRAAGKQARQPAPSGTHGPPLVPPLPSLPYSGSWLHNPVGCLATLLVA